MTWNGHIESIPCCAAREDGPLCRARQLFGPNIFYHSSMFRILFPHMALCIWYIFRYVRCSLLLKQRWPTYIKQPDLLLTLYVEWLLGVVLAEHLIKKNVSLYNWRKNIVGSWRSATRHLAQNRMTDYVWGLKVMDHSQTTCSSRTILFQNDDSM